MMRSLRAALATAVLCLAAAPALAQTQQAVPAAGISVLATGGFTSPNPGIAHAAGTIVCDNATQCTSGSSSAGVMKMQFSSVSTGVALGVPNAVVRLTRATLRKSGFGSSQQTNAAFRIHLNSAVPSGLTGVKDGDAYSPKIADKATSQQYIDCTTGNVNGDNMGYACTFPNGAAFLDVQTDAKGNIDAWIQANGGGNYTALTSETWDLRLLGDPKNSATAQ